MCGQNIRPIDSGVAKKAYSDNSGDYSRMDDAELLALCSKGDALAEEALLHRYSRLVRAITRTYNLSGLERDDLIQEGMIGLLKAARSYDPEKKVPFISYASIIIRRRLLGVRDSQMTGASTPLAFYIPYNESMEDGGDADDPALTAIGRDEFSTMLTELEGRLSPLERKALNLFLQGYSVTEISGMTGLSLKSTDNAVTRVKKKARLLRESREKDKDKDI